MSTTYTNFIAKVEQDLDLEEENFIQSSEMLGYTNEGLREVEKQVLTIYQDYLLDSAYLPLVLGTSKYNRPSGIFANKIRKIVYTNGSLIYEIKEIKGSQKFMKRAFLRYANPTDEYMYMMLNNSTNGIQIELSPASKETSSTNIEIFFIRKVDVVSLGTDFVDKDVPESLNYLYSYVKGKCKQKENAGVMPPDAQQEIDMQMKLLVDTLTSMIIDDSTEIEKDMSFYEEIS